MFVVCLLLAFVSPVVFQGRCVCQGLLQTGHSLSVCDGSPGQSSMSLLPLSLLPWGHPWVPSSAPRWGMCPAPTSGSATAPGPPVLLWLCGWKGHFCFSSQQPGGAEGPLSTALRSRVFLEAASDREMLLQNLHWMCFHLLHLKCNLSVKAQCYL